MMSQEHLLVWLVGGSVQQQDIFICFINKCSRGPSGVATHACERWTLDMEWRGSHQVLSAVGSLWVSLCCSPVEQMLVSVGGLLWRG